ncbi:hypothetical protein L6R49_04720 [Myxococcota bacterium]|nr:hypothetical protein [Myxococcota bacterium]
MTRPCPRCARQNAAHRAACLYCGEPLPDPAPPPEAPRARAVPADLDRLVAEALRGKGVKALHDALRQANEAPVADVADVAAVTPVADVAPVASVTPEPAAEVVELAPAPLDPSAQALAAVTEAEEALAFARERLAEGETAQAVAALRRLAQSLAARLPELPPEPSEAPEGPADAADEPVPLPPFRFGWALVIDGLADAARAPALASALGQDLATARLHAVSAHPKVVMRGEDEAALQARAERLRAEGVHTSVLHRSMVQSLGRPPLARSFVWGGPVLALDGRAYWEGDPEEVRALKGLAWPWTAPSFGVLGEVTVVRSRSASAPGRFTRKTLGTGPTVLDERRIGVLDLWGEDGARLRLVEGLTDAGEARSPFRAIVEAITAAAPGLRVTARRVCRPEERRPTGEPGESLSRSGWPTFEEHTRLCWLHERRRPG